ncbi:MAG: hypothetical protein CTY31_04230 [Hyphomicrobium sp.]|nr:MAG: hypothetical protein CTY31_04230 [Hyphomicrobium sp.]
MLSGAIMSTWHQKMRGIHELPLAGRIDVSCLQLQKAGFKALVMATVRQDNYLPNKSSLNLSRIATVSVFEIMLILSLAYILNFLANSSLLQ